MPNQNIRRIVLTGGPCAGKTTALVRVIEHFTSIGYKVFTVPEVPTMLIQAGMDYLTKNEEFFYEGEKATLELQLMLEDKFMALAQTLDVPSVIVCDRGTLDISTYLNAEQWERITASVGVDNAALKQRYDAVLHLVSAANGAEQFYTTATNAARLEQANEEGIRIARELDKKIIKVWSGHPHMRVINNAQDFESKLNRVLVEISNVLGIPQPIEENRKYIVEVIGDIPEYIESSITQTYLVADPDCEVRLRRRGWNGNYVNVHLTKKKLSDRKELVTERQVNNNLYQSLLQQADPYRNTIKKVRKSFIWQGQFFELDSFIEPHAGLVILETKGLPDCEAVKFPPFLRVVADITGNKKYYNYNLALR